MLLTKELPFITKILVPKNRDHIVNRGRLVNSMKAALNKKAQVICAPAGYGKTALLSEFAGESELPLCWFSCAPEDQDPSIALSYCLQSIRTPFPQFGTQYRPLLRESPDDDWLSQVGYFISALHSDVEGRLIFVFDNFHWIHGKKELEEAFSLLVQRAPDKVHFVLTSREWPSLPCLPRLTAENQISSLDVRDLRFTIEETSHLLTRLWGRSVDREEAEQINDRTGGWAAAILMTAQLQRGGETQRPSKAGEGRALFDYLSQEVFEQLPASLQHFLLQISVLQEFTAEFCNSLLGTTRAEELISQVQGRGLFIEERSGEGKPYKIHDLFREYLYQRLCSDHSEEKRRLHRRAAVLCSELEDHDAAIYHYLEGEQRSEAIELVKRIAGTYYNQGRWQKLDFWLTRFPKQTIEDEPELLLLSGQVRLRLGDPIGSLERLDKLVSGVHAGDRGVTGRALVAKSTAYRRLGHQDMAISSAEEGLSILQVSGGANDDLAEGYKQLGSAFMHKGEYPLGEQNFKAALSLISKENLRLYSFICNDLGVTQFGLGRLELAANYLEEARVGLLKLGSEGPMAEAMINLGLVYYHKGEFDLAFDEVSEAYEVAQRAQYPRVAASALMNLAMVQGALGLNLDSLATSTRALELARQLLDHRLIAESTEDLGSAYRRLGETSKAEVLLHQALAEVEESDEKYVESIYHISLGKLYFQAGSRDSALEHLAVAEELLAGFNNYRRMAEVKLYQAAIHYRDDRINKALELLNQAGELLDHLGYDGFLLADGHEVLDVLRFGAAKYLGGGVFARLVGRLAQQRPLPEGGTEGTFAKINTSEFPTIKAVAFGNPLVILDNHVVTDAEWRSRKAKELYFFMLQNRRWILTHEQRVKQDQPEQCRHE